MFEIDKAINEWITQNRNNLPEKTIYSSHMSPGEGEHKIMDYIRQGDVYGTGGHVIWGLDADLIMLSLLSPIPNMFLYKEYLVLDYSQGTEQMGIEALRDEYLNIELIKNGIYADLGKSTSISDYVVMMTTIGNDFLPHQPSLEELDQSINQMIAAYRETSTGLTVQNGLDYQINLLGLSEWFNNMGDTRTINNTQSMIPSVSRTTGTPVISGSNLVGSNNEVKIVQSRESELIEKRTDITYKFPMPALINSKDPYGNYDFQVFRDNWYTDVFAPHDVLAAEAAGIDTSVTNQDITDMCYQYIGGMAWVLVYYTKGPSAVNNRWYYPYYHAPLFVDVGAILNYIVSSGNLDVLPYWDRLPGQDEINVLWQLIAVLPISSADLLPSIIRPIASTKSLLADYYPSDFIIERWGINQEWRGIPILPFVDIDRVAKIVSIYTNNLTQEQLSKYDASKDIMIDRTNISREDVLAQMQQTASQIEQRFITGRERGAIVKSRRGRNRDRGGRGRGRGGRGRGGRRNNDNRQRDYKSNNTGGSSLSVSTTPSINKPVNTTGNVTNDDIMATLMASAIKPGETLATGRSLGGAVAPSSDKKRRGGSRSARGNFNNRNTSRGSYKGRRGSNKGRRGSNKSRRGSNRGRRGGYNQNRGGYNQNRGGYNQNRGGYNQNRGGYNQYGNNFAPSQSMVPSVTLTPGSVTGTDSLGIPGVPRTQSQSSGGLGGVRLSKAGGFSSNKIIF